MKKTNNKGFSLVELIIVIAIMAILAGAIAPALIRYIDKSRKSNDVTSSKTIKTAIETALGNEDIYAYLTAADDDTTCNLITIKPGVKTEASGTSNAVSIDVKGTLPDDLPDDIEDIAKKEIGTNIGEKTPKLKYKKAWDGDGFTGKPENFYALISPKGTVYVLIGGSSAPTTVDVSSDNKMTCDDAYLICPEICEAYQ